MKKKCIAQSGLFSVRALLVCAAAYFIVIPIASGLGFFRADTPAKSFQRTLTFAERVAYQRAIEDVYWRHRIWPKERPDPKPPLDAVMSQAQLERKVHDYLRKSQALQDYWQQRLLPSSCRQKSIGWQSIRNSPTCCANSFRRWAAIR